MVSSVNVGVALKFSKLILIVVTASINTAVIACFTEKLIIFAAWIAKSLKVIGRCREKAGFMSCKNRMKLAA
jgi:hypothetical protein